MMRYCRPAAIMVFTTIVACAHELPIHYAALPTDAAGALQIITVDVGQGEATLVLYRGKSLLIDAGHPLKEPMITSQRIPPRLDALLGSRKVDYLLVTHYHADHIGGPGHRRNQPEASGLFALFEQESLRVGTLLDRGSDTLGGKGPTQYAYEAALKQWLAAGLVEQHRVARAGDTLDMGKDLKVEVVVSAGNGYLDMLQTLFPTWLARNPPSENDYSVGLKVTLGDFEWFSGGDLTGANVVRRFGGRGTSYNDIESQVAQAIGAIEVYRVDHHGSAHSTNACFAQVLHPQVSVFSTGDNGYGHPTLQVVERLRKYGRLYITDGAAPEVRPAVSRDIVGNDVIVVVSADGKHYWVNGDAYTSLSDSEEAARPDARTTCQPDTDRMLTPEIYKQAEDNAAE